MSTTLTPSRTRRPATERQVLTIAKTRTRKVITPELAASLAAWDLAAEQGIPSIQAASNLIDRLFAAEWLPRTPASPPTDASGALIELAARQVYRAADGRVIRIQQSRETGNLYGKLLHQPSGSWDYLPHVTEHLAGARLLTLDEAIAISAAIGQCVRCSRTLTAEASVKAGIGPICSQAFGA